MKNEELAVPDYDPIADKCIGSGASRIPPLETEEKKAEDLIPDQELLAKV